MVSRLKSLLPLSILFCGCLSAFFGKELCWDLAHYHFYIPFAFLQQRQLIDYWPSSYIHQYLNPTLDIFNYLLITHFSPRTTEFILGGIHGLNLWLLFLIARHFKCSVIAAILIALLGMYGPTALPGIGSFQNDNLISIFVLAFLLLQLKTVSLPAQTVIANGEQRTNRYTTLSLLSAGLLLGLGFGLKLTAGIYIVGAIIAGITIPLPYPQRIKMLFIWGSAALIGTLITAGHWMYAMWLQHHNPLFPFFNNLFHSTDFFNVNWRDQRFLPKDIWQTLFFPFYFSFDGRTADAPFRDFRFAVLYGLFILAAIQWFWQKRTARLALDQRWLYTFVISAYIIWQSYFSIARYVVVLEMLAPLVILLLLQQLIRERLLRFALTSIILYALAITMVPIQMIRIPRHTNDFFNVTLPSTVQLNPKATVLVAFPAYVRDTDPRPQAYLVPFFPAQWRFIGVPFWHEKYLAENNVTHTITQLLAITKDKIFLLTSDRDMPELYRTAQEFKLKPAGTCENIYSDRQAVTHQEVLLCPVVKAS